MSVCFGRTTQNSFPSGSARTAQASAPVCPMSTRRAPSVRRRSISWSRSAALQETLYLFSTRANAVHILRGLAEAREGAAQPIELEALAARFGVQADG